MKNAISLTLAHNQKQTNHFNLERINKYLGNDELAIKEILLVVISEIKLSSNKIENCIFLF